MYASLWTHRRTGSVLLSGLGQRRWEVGSTVIHLRFRLSPCSRHRIVAASHPTCNFSVQTVLPTPSLKLTPNGMARRPGRAGGLREVGVTWTAPTSIARKLRARRAAITLTGRNPGLWTDYSGIDLEVSTRLDDSDRTRDFPTVPAVRYWITRVSLGY